jgi:hypothetical protein
VRKIFLAMMILSYFAAPVFGGSLSESVFRETLQAAPAFELEEGDRADSALDRYSSTEIGRTTGSAFRQAAWSLLVPGLAQHRMGYGVRSSIYFALEGMSWLAIGGFLWQGYNEENTFKEYAVALAGIEGTDRSDDYYELIGQYTSSAGPGGYNEYLLREARDLYYPNLDAMEEYYNANVVTGDESWEWRTEKALDLYNDMRHRSSTAYRRALYSFVFAMTLRVVSTADAVRLARSEDQSGRNPISLGIERRRDGILLSVGRQF